MDYDGNSFQSRWRKGQLKIRAMQMEDNTLGLLKIVLDAAVSNGQFKMCWDLRDFKNPSISQWFTILSFVNTHAAMLDKHTDKLGLLVSPRIQRLVTYAIRLSPPSCPYAISSDWKEIKFFMQD